MTARQEPPSVLVKASFQRSVRLDVDFDRPDALANYILQPTARTAVETVARHVSDTQQRAFTWTGPYGGGKSSLALALSVLAGGTPSGRRTAKEVLGVKAGSLIDKVFGCRKRWLVLPVVGRRQMVQTAIGEALDKFAPMRGRRPNKQGARDVVAELVRRADDKTYGGVLLVLDELGKFLEAAAAATGDDTFFYQELAEAASRCHGRLVIVGVLHQAFEQYASKLGRDAREEWAKVQGRYVDIPVVSGTDETLELIGRAIETDARHVGTRQVAEVVADSIRRRRPATPRHLATSLDRCWPLHPVTAALLGPSSRRRFGQNERSVFGFLTSAEPLGFREFLAARGIDDPSPYYTPARYWNYLRANLENAILASADGHRWAISAEAVERVEARFGEPHVSLVKTVGLIELFRNGSGIAADDELLEECVPPFPAAQIRAALQDLARASVLIYRKHLQAWAIFSGSDFDIDAAVAAAASATAHSGQSILKALPEFGPVSARRHYFETGTLRWFDRAVVLASETRQSSDTSANSRGTGKFVLLLPEREYSEDATEELAAKLSICNGESGLVIAYGVPRGHLRIMEQAAELSALEYVARNSRELDGDSVARREIDARLIQVRSALVGALNEAFVQASWYFEGRRHDTTTSEGLAPLASKICQKAFRSTPHIHSELVNRAVLSTSAAKAQRLLLHRMVDCQFRPNLGYEGFPADAGLYYTVLSPLGLHRRDGEEWGFFPPDAMQSPAAASLVPLWVATKSLLESSNEAITLESVYTLWRGRPFGLKDGVLPVLALAFLLANRSSIAIYVEGVFTPELTDACVDEWLQDPARIAWKLVRMDAAAKSLLTRLAARLEKTLGRSVSPDPLDSARAMVSIVLAMPTWTQRTSRLSERAKTIRTLLLRASDPVKVIFNDLPELLGTQNPETLVAALGDVIHELEEAYPRALESIGERLLHAIDHGGDWESLQRRAQSVQGASGDLRLDAFASRLRVYTGRREENEGLVALASSKPPQSLNDNDFESAALQLAKWAFDFRKVEAMVAIQGRRSNRQAMAVVLGGQKTISATFDVSREDSELVSELASRMLANYEAGVKPQVFLAALVRAGSQIIDLEEANG